MGRHQSRGSRRVVVIVNILSPTRLRSTKGLLMKKIANLVVNTVNGPIKSNAMTTTLPVD